MNCAGSERAENNKGFDCRNMGEVLGKECVKDETSFAHSNQNSLGDVGDSAASSDAASESESDKELSLDAEEDISWLLSFNGAELSTEKCKCDGCLRPNESIDNEKKNAKILLSSWKEFQNYIRNVYINSPFDSTQKVEIIPLEENERLHEIIQVMRLCDPYQLFQKIEDEVQAMMLKSRIRQLNLLKDGSNQSLAEEFITGLIEEYVKLLSSAVQLSPAIEILLGPQLQRFGLTWDMLNKHLYQSLVYSHYDIQKNLPQFIVELRTMLPLKDHLYHELVHQYLAFDDEMTLVDAAWKNVEPLILEYKNFKESESEILSNLRAALKSVFTNKHNSINGNASNEVDANAAGDALRYCPNCLTKRGCPCDECLITHMACCEGLGSPSMPGSPVSRSMSPVKDKEVESREAPREVETCECHACTVPPPELMDCSDTFNQLTGKNTHGEGFQLYPHIHGTVSENLNETENISSLYSNLKPPTETSYSLLRNLQTQGNPVANVSQPNVTSSQLLQPAAVSKVPSQPSASARSQQETKTGQLPKAPPAVSQDQLPNRAPPPTSAQNSAASPPKPVAAPKVLPSEKPTAVAAAESVAAKRVVQPKEAPNPPPVNSASVKPTDVKVDAKNIAPSKIAPPKENAATIKAAVEKSKVAANNKGSACLISSLCGKCCLRHGPDCMKTPGCDKNTDKNLASMSKLGLPASAGPRGAIRTASAKEIEQAHKVGKGHSCGKLKSHELMKKTTTRRELSGQEHEDSSGQDDTCSERSNSTSTSIQKDSRHCDCCYCEVFGHGVPSVAPVSRNYQEMRERLRIRLNMKKSAKCKAAQAGEATQQGQKNAAGTANSQDGRKNIGKEDLETVLKYIEGKTREECKDPKRIAKRARQRQRKLEEKERLEQEEADRKRLEAMKKQVTISVVNKNNKSKNQPAKQVPAPPVKEKIKNPPNSNIKSNQNKNNIISNRNNSNANNKKSGNNNNGNNSIQPRNSQTLNLSGLKSLVEKSDPNAEPKMVTIRRVMAPFSAEPTVTITLKGSTPDKDKVLFMLKNGSETYQPEEREPVKKSKRKKKKSKQEQEYYEEEEPYYEEEPEPIEEKRTKKKKKKNKDEKEEKEIISKSSRAADRRESSKTTAQERTAATSKNNKNKNSKAINSNCNNKSNNNNNNNKNINNNKSKNSNNNNNNNSKSNSNKNNTKVSSAKTAIAKSQTQVSNKNKQSNNSVSVKSKSQGSSTTLPSNSKANNQKSVPVLKTQKENLKKQEANKSNNKNVKNSAKNNSNSNNNNNNNNNNKRNNNNNNNNNVNNKNNNVNNKNNTVKNKNSNVNNKNSNSQKSDRQSGKSNVATENVKGSSTGKSAQKQSAVSGSKQQCKCSATQKGQTGKSQSANANANAQNSKQSKSKKKKKDDEEEIAQTTRQVHSTQVKGKLDQKSKQVAKSGRSVCESVQKVQQRQEAKQTRPQEKQQLAAKKTKVSNQRPAAPSHDMNSRFPMGDRCDRGKVVINTPSYRLSEVLSSIAPSPPPKEEINLENLRLPPGITITKIEGPITKSIRASEQPLHVSKPVPITPPIVVSTPALKPSHPPPPGNVIVVDTGRLKEVIKENSQNSAVGEATASGKKKKKKKKKESIESGVPTVGMAMPQVPAYGLKMPKSNPLMGKSGLTVLSANDARKMVPNLENQQATIIKTSDNMVTIRSPAFQQALNMHAYQNGPGYRPGMNGYNNVSLFRNDVDRITDGVGKLKMDPGEKLARQMRSLNIKEGSRASQIFAQAMAAAEQSSHGSGKKRKKRKKHGRSNEREVEPVESVFQPKDIDLENGDIDDDERELEAFKRFCLQSVPSERKNKVKVNLNIKDIVLKKKSSAIGCS